MIEYSDRPLKEEYDAEPVYYCTKCLSLDIRTMNDILDYCDCCGSTEIAQTNIYKWEEMYKKKYGKSFLNSR